MGHVNTLIKSAENWQPEDKNQAADAIAESFDHFGWTPSGLKSDKRKKQEKKRRELISRLREG